MSQVKNPRQASLKAVKPNTIKFLPGTLIGASSAPITRCFVYPEQAPTAEQLEKVDPNTAKGFAKLIAFNVENSMLSDAMFRQFVRNSVPTLFPKETYVPDNAP